MTIISDFVISKKIVPRKQGTNILKNYRTRVVIGGGLVILNLLVINFVKQFTDIFLWHRNILIYNDQGFLMLK